MTEKTEQKPTVSPPRDAKKRGGGSRTVFKTLRNEILELKLAPGSALDESGLAKRFEMSRSPIREALVRLSADGLVHTLENRSTIVAPLDLADLPRFVEALDYLQRVVTRLAAVHRSEDDLIRMTEAAEIYDQTCDTNDALTMSAANKEFHLSVASAGRNPYFTEMYRKLLDEGRRILHMHYARQRINKDPYPLSPEHFAMIEAIRQRDTKEADRLAHNHTRVFHERLVEFMQVEFQDPTLSPFESP